MSHLDPSFDVVDSQLAAEEAPRTLGQSGFDMQKLSRVGKGHHSKEKPMGFYSVGDRTKAWGGSGAFWGGVWGLLIAPAILALPGRGVVGLAGPVPPMRVNALEGPVVVGSLSALVAALTQTGMPQDPMSQHEAVLKVHKNLRVVHRGPKDQAKARALLAQAKSAVAA